jgi:hypothetical protein
VLYGVGARLDQRPELLFQLRRVDGNDLLAQAGAGVARPTKSPAKAKVLDDAALADVFGIEMAEARARPARDAGRPAAGRGGKAAATAAKATAKVVNEESTKKASASRTDAEVSKTPGAQPSRAAAKARTPAKTGRSGAARKSLTQAVAATGKKRGAPAGVAVKRKPKRRSHA